MYLFSNFINLFEYFFEKIINYDFFGMKVKPKVLLHSNMLFNYGLYLIASGQYIVFIYIIVTLFGSLMIVERSLITIRKRVVSTKQWRIFRSTFLILNYVDDVPTFISLFDICIVLLMRYFVVKLIMFTLKFNFFLYLINL